MPASPRWAAAPHWLAAAHQDSHPAMPGRHVILGRRGRRLLADSLADASKAWRSATTVRVTHLRQRHGRAARSKLTRGWGAWQCRHPSNAETDCAQSTIWH